MARILGVDLPRNKAMKVAIRSLYGVGPKIGEEVLAKAGIDENKKVSEWTQEEADAIRNVISTEFKVEGVLKSEIQLNIKRLMDIGCYRGLRHRKGLPLRGQRTKNNSRTRKGKRKTIANKKQVGK